MLDNIIKIIGMVLTIIQIFGIPTMLGAFIKNSEKQKKQTNEEFKALKAGLQAELRDSLLKEYKEMKVKGYCTYDEKKNWENMYKNYHALGENGVMDEIAKEVEAMDIKIE